MAVQDNAAILLQQALGAQGVRPETIQRMVNELAGPGRGGVDAALETINRLFPAVAPPQPAPQPQASPFAFAGPTDLPGIQAGLIDAIAQALPRVGAIAQESAGTLPPMASTISQGAELTGRLPSGSPTEARRAAMAQEAIEWARVGIAREQLALQREAQRLATQGRVDEAAQTQVWSAVIPRVTQMVESGEITNRGQLVNALAQEYIQAAPRFGAATMGVPSEVRPYIDMLEDFVRSQEALAAQNIIPGIGPIEPPDTTQQQPRSTVEGVLQSIRQSSGILNRAAERVADSYVPPSVPRLISNMAAEGATDNQIINSLLELGYSQDMARRIFTRLKPRIDSLRGG